MVGWWAVWLCLRRRTLPADCCVVLPFMGASAQALPSPYGLPRCCCRPISRLFMPAGVTVIHNPLVRQPMQILCDTVDLEEIGKVDPAIASVAADLGFGIGLKGGIARKLLKILHGTPEPATNDFDVDCIIVAEAGLTPAEETELRAAVTGTQLGHLVLEPKDVEVISKEGLKSYWLHRDVCLNEVLLMRLAPGAPLTLFYSNYALEDARSNVIRSIPHALKSGERGSSSRGRARGGECPGTWHRDAGLVPPPAQRPSCPPTQTSPSAGPWTARSPS